MENPNVEVDGINELYQGEVADVERKFQAGYRGARSSRDYGGRVPCLPFDYCGAGGAVARNPIQKLQSSEALRPSNLNHLKPSVLSALCSYVGLLARLLLHQNHRNCNREPHNANPYLGIFLGYPYPHFCSCAVLGPYNP